MQKLQSTKLQAKIEKNKNKKKLKIDHLSCCSVNVIFKFSTHRKKKKKTISLVILRRDNDTFMKIL